MKASTLKKVIKTVIAIIAFVGFICLLVGMDNDDALIVGCSLLGAALALWIDYALATYFYHVATEKGYYEACYLWIPFAFSFVGYILVAALPDNENLRLSGIYKQAKSCMSSATTEDGYKKTAQLFETILSYLDSELLYKECLEKAEIARKDAILTESKAKMATNEFSNYNIAIKLLESISGWKDADVNLSYCKKKIEELKEKSEAERIEREKQAEIARQKAIARAKIIKKLALIITPIVCVTIASVLVITQVIIPNSKYNDALALIDAGKYAEAHEALIALDGYKDSAEKAVLAKGKETVEKIKNAKAGDHIFFGKYEQDGNVSNGSEDIEWLVLEVRDGKSLVISKYALDAKQYNSGLKSTNWETCSLRKWLNNDFINSAFSTGEKAIIPTVTISADQNSENAIQDQVFLLSADEANYYFSSNDARQCRPTAFAITNGVYESGSNDGCYWWLRSQTLSQDRAHRVDRSGETLNRSAITTAINAIRPALWIDLNP